MEFTIGWDTDGDGGRVAVAATAPILLLFLAPSISVALARTVARSPSRRPPSPPPMRAESPLPDNGEIGSRSFSLALALLSPSLAPSDDINDDGHAGIYPSTPRFPTRSLVATGR